MNEKNSPEGLDQVDGDRLLAALVESSQDAIIGKTTSGIISTWNHAAEKLYGYSRNEMLGRNIAIIIPPNRVAEETAILERVTKGEKLEHYETERIRKDGSIVPVSLTVSPIRDRNGVVLGASAIARDLSDNRREQQRALATEERFRRALLAFIDIGDPQRVLQAVVDAARGLVDAEYAALGVISEDRQLQAFIHSGMDASTVARIGALPEGKGILRAVIVENRPMRLADLAQHPASAGFPTHHPPMRSFLGAPIRSASGVTFGNIYLTNKRSAPEFTALDEDLIVALASQAAIAIENSRGYERERSMALRMRQLAEAAIALTEELRVEHVLQKIVDLARSLVGAEYAALGVLGHDAQSLDQFIHSGMDPATVEAIGPLPQGRGVLRAVIVEKRALRLDDMSQHPASVGFPPNHPPMVSFLGVPIAYKGKIIGNLYLTNKIGAAEFSAEDEVVAGALAAQAAVAIENAEVYARDADLRQRLQDLNAAKSDFLSMASHDLRQPITVISGLAYALETHPERMSAEELAGVAARIRRSADRLDTIVEDLLQLTRLEAGRLHMLIQPVRVEHAVKAALDGLELPPERTVDVDIDGDPIALVDAPHFERVIVNLLNNALRHGGPHIRIEGSSTADGVKVVVSDDGPGVPEDLRSKIFDRFRSGAGKGAGWGLGLAIARGFTEGFGGRLWYEAGDPGARFCLVVPAAHE